MPTGQKAKKHYEEGSSVLQNCFRIMFEVDCTCAGHSLGNEDITDTFL